MKNRFLLAGLFAVSALMTACSDDNSNEQAIPDSVPSVEQPAADSKVQVTFHGVADGDAKLSKTALADDGKSVIFTDGDAISLFDGNGNNCEFNSTVAAGGATADFTGDVQESADNYYVLYPYQKAASIAGGEISATLPAIQVATPNSFDPAANLSVAITEDDKSFKLLNIGSLLKITTSQAFDRIVVKSISGEKIAGAIKVSFNAEGKPVAAAADAAVTEIELVPASDQTTIAAGTYYVALLSGVYANGISVELYDGDDVFTKNYKKSLTFARSKGLNAAIKDFDHIVFNISGNGKEVKLKMIGIPNYTNGYYYIAETETTQALWQAVMGNNPSYADVQYYKGGVGDDLPVNQVSWNDINDGNDCFIKKLNAATGKSFRLPSSAEWKYAAKGGDPDALYSGCNLTGDLKDYAWYQDNIDGVYGCREVATKKPNGYGLYDMSANLWEWCEDENGSYRFNRGGGWGNAASNCEVSIANSDSPGYSFSNLGFRLALSPQFKK